jgi:hypothetical protein
MEIKDKITEMEREPFASAKIELEHIEIIDSEKASIIIETYKPIGLFMLQDGEKWVGIDNNSGSAWTEEFTRPEECEAWLRSENDDEE